MNIHEFFMRMFQLSVIIPAAFLCYLPMRNQLKYRLQTTIGATAALLAVTVPGSSYFSMLLDVDINSFLLPMLLLFFLFYHFMLKATLSQTLVVFCSVCALMAFPSNFAYAYDAWLHPLSSSAQFSPQATVFQLVLTLAMTALCACPLYRCGRRMIDNSDLSHVWYLFLPLPLVFFLFNMIMIPRNYQTIHIGRVFPSFHVILTLMLFLMVFTHILFYRISMTIITVMKDKERIHFFEMQELQYCSQKNYIEQTEKLRHDFRQSVYTLWELAASKDWESLEKYLIAYEKTLPRRETLVWCQNSAVNALLNYYAGIARHNTIRLKWEINLPASFLVPEPDLCSLLGNILENAISGSMTQEASLRYLNLSVTLRGDSNLYIVCSNNFNGIVRQKRNHYLSTKRKGSGYGISSITMTAEKYNGVARFSHSTYEFSVDVMIRQTKG